MRFWKLKLGTWNFAPWDFETSNLELEIWNLETGDFEIWDWIWKLEFYTWEWKFWIKNLGFENFWSLNLNPLSLIHSKNFLSLFFFFVLEIGMTLLFSWFDFWFFRRRIRRKIKKEKDFFFFWELIESTQFDWVDLATCWVLSVGVEFWPPICLVFLFFFFASSFITFLPLLTLFIFFLHLIFLLQFTISSLKKKSFSKLLNLPSLISLNISLDPCVLEHFCHTPTFGETIFKPIFSLHQNVFFFKWTLFSYFSWQEIWYIIWMEWWGGAPLRPQDPCSIFSHGHQGEFFFDFFVWKNVVSCFIESLMARHCHLLCDLVGIWGIV